MAKDMFDLWHMVLLRRIELNCWEMVSPPNPRHTGNPNLHVLWSVAASNIDRARRRWRRATLSPISDAHMAITMAKGSFKGRNGTGASAGISLPKPPVWPWGLDGGIGV